jgi:hypothetical protein
MAPPNTPYILFYKMTSSTSAEASSSTQTSSSNQTIKVTSPTRKIVEDQGETISKKQCLIEKLDYDDEASKLPEFCDLPLRIQDLIRKDNIDYQMLQRQLLNKERTRIFQYKTDRKPDSDDEQPPSNCGGNDLDYVNKFIY